METPTEQQMMHRNGYHPVELEIVRFDRVDILTTSSYSFQADLNSRKYQTDMAMSPWEAVQTIPTENEG